MAGIMTQCDLCSAALLRWIQQMTIKTKPVKSFAIEEKPIITIEYLRLAYSAWSSSFSFIYLYFILLSSWMQSDFKEIRYLFLWQNSSLLHCSFAVFAVVLWLSWQLKSEFDTILKHSINVDKLPIERVSCSLTDSTVVSGSGSHW